MPLAGKTSRTIRLIPSQLAQTSPGTCLTVSKSATQAILTRGTSNLKAGNIFSQSELRKKNKCFRLILATQQRISTVGFGFWPVGDAGFVALTLRLQREESKPVEVDWLTKLAVMSLIGEAQT